MPVNFAPAPQQGYMPPATTVGPQAMDTPKIASPLAGAIDAAAGGAAQGLGGPGQAGNAAGAAQGADPGMARLVQAIMQRRAQAAQPTLPQGGSSPTGITRGQNVLGSLPPGWKPGDPWPGQGGDSPQPAPQQ